MTYAILLFTIINYYIFDLGTESFYLIFQIGEHRLARFSQFAGGCATYSFCIPTFSIIFGSCWLFIFIAEDIAKDLANFNSNETTNENLKRFCDVVQMYSDAKE